MEIIEREDGSKSIRISFYDFNSFRDVSNYLYIKYDLECKKIGAVDVGYLKLVSKDKKIKLFIVFDEQFNDTIISIDKGPSDLFDEIYKDLQHQFDIGNLTTGYPIDRKNRTEEDINKIDEIRYAESKLQIDKFNYYSYEEIFKPKK